MPKIAEPHTWEEEAQPGPVLLFSSGNRPAPCEAKGRDEGIGAPGKRSWQPPPNNQGVSGWSEQPGGAWELCDGPWLGLRQRDAGVPSVIASGGRPARSSTGMGATSLDWGGTPYPGENTWVSWPGVPEPAGCSGPGAKRWCHRGMQGEKSLRPEGTGAAERPGDDLNKNKRGDIQDERKGVKKVKLAQVQEGEIASKIGSHWDVSICLRDVERGHKGRRRQQARKNRMVV